MTATSVIVGAGSGMGAAVARRFVDRGPVVLADRDLGSVTALAASLGPAARAVTCDVTDQGEVDAVLGAPLSDAFYDALSGLGLDPDEPGFAYALSKRGVIRQAQSRARPWGQRGARILSLSPGIIETPMGRQEAAGQPLMADMVADSALGRMGAADEVAAVVEFLCSAGASFMTGTDVLVDGGEVATFGSVGP